MTVVEHRPVSLPGQPAGAPQVVAVPGDNRLPQGAAQFALGQFYNASGVIEVKRRGVQVPVDGNGKVTHQHMVCPVARGRCEPRWVTAGAKTPPLCPGHGKPYIEFVPPTWLSQVLPWRDLLAVVRAQAPPLYALAAAAGAGALADAADVSAWPLLGAVPLAFEATRRSARWWRGRKADAGVREAINRWSREVGYCTAGGCLATGIAAAGTGPVWWTTLLALWAPAAGTWWKRRRDERNRPHPVPTVEQVRVTEVAPIDFDEQQTVQYWTRYVAARPNPQTGQRGGKLAGTWLEGWRRVEGGWGATICSERGQYTGEAFMAATGAIASAYRMKKSMITVIPDPEDETQAMVLAQRTSPIRETVHWAGPQSIDVVRGVAPVAAYADGDPVWYELYRPGWGVPHVAAFGTTGSGKSEFLNQLFAIDRWAHYIDDHGAARGIVANFLIDPQQGQSFAPFIDDLAAPPACSLPEAMLLMEALYGEMLRRNRYLAKLEYRDERGRKRKGRKWWNPLIDGPILSVTIDEAHDYLAHKPFAALVTKAGRMWRKCGGQIRLATHTPLLSDLGGSMALRDMLTGGFVWVGRTANSLSGPTAFNGRLPADPRTIPAIPGTAYILTPSQPKAMLARTAWVEDYYDWVRDDADEPIGYPAVLPPETLEAFGPEFNNWCHLTRMGVDFAAPQRESVTVAAGPDVKSVDAVRAFLANASGPLTVPQIDEGLQAAGVAQASGKPFTTRTVRDAVAKLKQAGEVEEGPGKTYTLTAAREEAEAAHAEQGALELSELDGVE